MESQGFKCAAHMQRVEAGHECPAAQEVLPPLGSVAYFSLNFPYFSINF